MTEENLNTELSSTNRPSNSSGNNSISDQVIIEIIHAFKEIMIEYITRKYQAYTDK